MNFNTKISLTLPRKIEGEELRHILTEHAEWLKDHDNGKRADLSNITLFGADLQGADLSYADFSGADMMCANLSGTNLSFCNMYKARMGHCNLSEAILTNANLSQADLSEANLRKANLNYVNLAQATLTLSNLENAKLSHTCLFASNLSYCKFNFADLKFCDLYHTDIHDAHFDNADLSYARLIFAKHSIWASFKNANLTGVDITDCDIDDDAIIGAKGVNAFLKCPAEGSFIAWAKLRNNYYAKLLVPKHSKRAGKSKYTCRVSEANVLDITNSDGTTITGGGNFFQNSDGVFQKGASISKLKTFDDSIMHDGDGIHIFLSLKEAVKSEYWKEHITNESVLDLVIDDEDEII